VNLQGYFIQTNFPRSYPNLGKYGKDVYIYKSLSQVAEPGHLGPRINSHNIYYTR
jgi:hypothetical protein